MTSARALDIAKIAAIAVGGYYVLKTLAKVGGGISDAIGEDPIEEGTSQNTPGNAANLSHAKFVYDAAADAIQTAVWDQSLFALFEDDDVIKNALLIAHNLDDVRQLSYVYGVRGANDAMSARYNLVQTVANYLDANLKSEVNAIYATRGINFAWN